MFYSHDHRKVDHFPQFMSKTYERSEKENGRAKT